MPFEDTFSVALSTDETLILCRQVMADMGWAVESLGGDHLLCTQILGSLTRMAVLPAKFEVWVTDQNGQSSVTTRHRKTGLLDFGQQARPQASNFRNRLLVAAARTKAAGAPQDLLSVEIENLKSLRDRAVLTPEEFEAAKARVLGR